MARGLCQTILAVLVLVLLAGAAPAEAAWVIVFPPDGALLTEENVEVTGYWPKASGAGVLNVASSGPAVKKSISSGRFTVEVKLHPGVNTITLGEDITRVFFAPGKVPSEASAYIEPDRHSVDNSCDDCHTPEWEDPGLAEEGGALCLMCHDDVTKDGEGEPYASLHPPAEDGECVECHAFHAGNIRSLSADDLMGVCFGCHDDFRDGEGLTLHPPAEEGECLGCHNPHASPYSALLTAEGSEVCFECHDNPGMNEEGEEWATPHAGLDDGCTACHNPHASGHGSLLAAETAAVCSECHDDMNVDEEGNEWGTPHPPVEDGECTACHSPHGSSTAGMLKLPPASLCAECHDDMTVDSRGNRWKNPHPPVDEEDCFSCHRPHGAGEAGLLVKAVPELCNECHDDVRLSDGGSAWYVTHPPVQEGRCNTCHKPHGTTLPSLLVGRAIELCKRCHTEIHEYHQEALGTEKVMVAEDFPTSADGRFYCIGCHRPHGSPSQYLWRGEMGELCIRCHRM